MSVSSFQKPRLDQIVIASGADPNFRVWSVFAWPQKSWYRNTFRASVSSYISPLAGPELSNLPFWYRKGTAVTAMSIIRISGLRTRVGLIDPLALTNFDATPELVSKGKYPIRGVGAGTYNLKFSFDGNPAFTVDLTTPLTTGNGDLLEIVRALNAAGSFAAVGRAFVAGIGQAAQLGITSLTDGASASIEIVTGDPNDCSELLGFSLGNENLYDEGDTAEVVGTFTQAVNTKST